MRAGALLRADLHDALVPPGDLDHPPPFARKQRQRFLDVDILARGACHHGHQRVPVVGRRNDHRVDLAVIEKRRESRR